MTQKEMVYARCRCLLSNDQNKYEQYRETTEVVNAQSTYAQQVSTKKNISFKIIQVGHECLLSPT